MNTYCNPLNLQYRFQDAEDGSPCRREAADPSIIFYQNQFWLFASKSGGYWHSEDLLEWTFVPDDKLPMEDYAPDVRVINDWIYFTASRRNEKCPVYRTQNPELDQWEPVGSHMPYWDPNQFQDDDGRVYLYFGCSNQEPIRGLELDPETMAPVGEPKIVIHNHQQKEHGWERCGENNNTLKPPWLEGAWMTKHDGRYYLQYAAPGTEFNVYADGVCVGERPLGPFFYAGHNPFSFKPGGFIGGAGHGSTFQDPYGNWWHASTMSISVRHNFERRLGIWPAGFDEEGTLFCNTRFGDYPMHTPQGPWDPWEDPFPGWMLLSYGKPTAASSALPDAPPEMAVDESVRTWWAAESSETDQWLELDLEGEATVNAVQVNFTEVRCRQSFREGPPLKHGYLLEASQNGSDWFVIADKRGSNEDVPHDYIELSSGVKARFLRPDLHIG